MQIYERNYSALIASTPLTSCDELVDLVDVRRISVGPKQLLMIIYKVFTNVCVYTIYSVVTYILNLVFIWVKMGWLLSLVNVSISSQTCLKTA